MKILEQIKKANQRLLKRIEQQIDLLDIDPEQTRLQQLYLFIDEHKLDLSILKSRSSYNYSMTLERENRNIIFRARFVFNEHSGNITIKEIYQNSLLELFSIQSQE